MSDEPVDHTKPHWCEHDGGDALVPLPNRLFYIGPQYSTATLATRYCPHVNGGSEPNPSEATAQSAPSATRSEVGE